MRTLFKEDNLRIKLQVFFEVGRPKKNVECAASLTITNRMNFVSSLANNNTSYSGLLPYW